MYRALRGLALLVGLVAVMMLVSLMATQLVFLTTNVPRSGVAELVAVNSALLSFTVALWIGFGIGRFPRLLGGKR